MLVARSSIYIVYRVQIEPTIVIRFAIKLGLENMYDKVKTIIIHVVSCVLISLAIPLQHYLFPDGGAFVLLICKYF